MTTAQTRYTGPTPADLANIPDVLKQRRQWVLWRGSDRIDKLTGEITGLEKVPIDPQTLTHASTTDWETWGTFEHCIAALPVALEQWAEEDPDAFRGGGLGFVFTSDDPFTGVDLDHCRNPDTQQIDDWAQRHINALASYTEVTPSRTGVHILAEGTLPPKGRKKNAVECYNCLRFFTMTGWHIPGTPPTIAARQDALNAFHAEIFGPPHTTHQQGSAQASSPPRLEDAALLGKTRAAKNGAKVTAL
jgi:putative DNA primase/helicase